MYTQELDSVPGSVSQVRACGNLLMRIGKGENIPVFIVAHVTKSGELAGPKIVEHMVDCVLNFTGERDHDIRILRAYKNRFGTTSEIGAFQMEEVLGQGYYVRPVAALPRVNHIELGLGKLYRLRAVNIDVIVADVPLIGFSQIHQETNQYVCRPGRLVLYKDHQPIADDEAQVVVLGVQKLVIQRDQRDIRDACHVVLRVKHGVHLEQIFRLSEQIAKYAVLGVPVDVVVQRLQDVARHTNITVSQRSSSPSVQIIF
jgi:hypothetical protein